VNVGRRVTLALMIILVLALLSPGSASAVPIGCEGMFYGIEATCMFRLGGRNLSVTGVAFGVDDLPARITVELWEWPVSVGDDPLARCSTTGGVLQVCQQAPGTGLSLNTMVFCRITGRANLGAFSCASY
jgi:hypothetical protein